MNHAVGHLVGRLLAATTLVGALVVLTGVPAQAAMDASMSDVESTGQAVTGVLTFRSPDVVQVDPDSLTATIDGTERPATVSGSTSIDRTAMLVIDTSGSMGADGMATVRSASRTYLEEAPEDVKVGVTTFADTAGVDLAPTTNRAQVSRVVNGLAARGETSLYAAVMAAAKELGTDGERSMVLLSDGADTMSENPKRALARATKAVRDRGIRVDVVRFQTEDKDTMNALDGFAKAGGGSVLAADDAAAVGDAFQSAARALKSQAKFEITTPKPLSGTHTVRIEGTAAGTPFAVEQNVNFGSGPVAAGPEQESEDSTAALPLPAIDSPWQSFAWALVGAVAIGAAVFLLGFGLFVPTVKTRRQQRLEDVDFYAAPVARRSRSEDKKRSEPLSERLVGIGDKAMSGRRSTPRTMQLINRADLPLRAGEWFVLCVVAIIVGVALGVVLLPEAKVIGVVLGVLLGAALPQVLLRLLAARRAKAFERLLPDALVLVATSLRSGFGLTQSLDAVARDAAPPVSKEFSRALAETRIGTDIADALDRMAERMGSEAMEMAVMAMRIQREVGGNLAETLGTTAQTLREREALHQQMRTLSAEGRLSAQILIALPVGVFLYMLMVNREYIELLWTHPLGLLMSVGALVMLVIGIFWMRNVVKIEV